MKPFLHLYLPFVLEKFSIDDSSFDIRQGVPIINHDIRGIIFLLFGNIIFFFFTMDPIICADYIMIFLCLRLFLQVIVRDIVSKVVIAQFRAHKSPISALCFDPSGMLLVTASVQGHNINIFKIMPGLQGSSCASDAGTSYVHLYRLQRGLTNAVRAL